MVWPRRSLTWTMHAVLQHKVGQRSTASRMLLNSREQRTPLEMEVFLLHVGHAICNPPQPTHIARGKTDTMHTGFSSPSILRGTRASRAATTTARSSSVWNNNNNKK